MPKVEDLPVPAQKQLRAARGESDPATNERKSLLQRLATVGFGRRDEPNQGGGETSAKPPEAPARVAPAPAPAEYAKRPSASPSYRPAQGQLDQQGRAAPPARPMDDDQLEIPAFLRRQSN